MATWPKGRLVALQCDEVGEFATVAVIPTGDKISLNAIVKPTGYIKVSVRTYGSREDLPGHTFEETDRLVGDNLAMPVTWNGEDLIPHNNTSVIFRFRLKQCKLFGVEFH